MIGFKLFLIASIITLVVGKFDFAAHRSGTVTHTDKGKSVQYEIESIPAEPLSFYEVKSKDGKPIDAKSMFFGIAEKSDSKAGEIIDSVVPKSVKDAIRYETQYAVTHEDFPSVQFVSGNDTVTCKARARYFKVKPTKK